MGNGDEGPKKSSPGTPRPAADTPGRLVVRSLDGTAGESSMMGAADTAIAVAVSNSGSLAAAKQDSNPGFTDPEANAPAHDDEDADSLVGTTLLGRYSITKKIGQGGMGAVYEAQHTLIGKRVAVKVLLDKYAKKDQIVARLEQEARLASSIGHEHIIDITDFGTTGDGRTFVVMEFLEGESLAECLQREGTLPEGRILQIAVQIGSALAAAHAKGVVHRDIKPENVFLLQRKDKDFAKVVDFGISKNLRSTGEGPESPRLTQTGMVLGTPLYMSPEQARGDEELDHRIDVYALGVIMYELATGKVPFSGTNYLSVISQVLNDDPVPPRQLRPELSAEFEAIVLRALDKDRALRYQTTDEIVADLTTLLEDPLRSTQRPRIHAPKRRGKGSALKILAWVVGVSVVIAAVAVTVSLMMGGDEPKAAVKPDAGVAVVKPVDAAPVTPIDAAPPAELTAEIWIDTKPHGAMLYEGGRSWGPTPVAYPAVIGDETITLIAKLPGYNDTPINIRPLIDKARTEDDPIKITLVKGQKKIAPKPPKPPKVDAGVPKIPDPPSGECPGGIKPNPITGKC